MSVRFVFGASTIYLAVSAAEMTSSLVSVPIMTRLLSRAEYGVILFIANGTALLNLLFGFALTQGLVVLFSGAASEAAKRNVATTILASITVLSFVVFGSCALLARIISTHLLDDAGGFIPIAIAASSGFFNGLSLSLAWIIRLREQHKLYLLVQLPAVLMQLGLLVWLLISAQLGLSALYIATSAAGLFTTVAYACSNRKLLAGRFDRSVLLEAGRIGARMLPWQLATLLTTNTAGFFLVHAGYVEQAGLFAVAASMSSVLVSISNSFNNVWTPFVLLRHAEPDMAERQRRIFEVYSAALLIAASAICLFAQEVFAILLGPAFRDGFHYVPPLAFVYCLFCFANNFAQGMQAKQHTAPYVWIGAVTAAVFLSVCLPLAKSWGASGVIAAMGAGFACMLVLLQVVSERLMPVAYPWPRHGLMWLVAVGVVGSAYALGSTWTGMTIKVMAALVVCCLPFLFGALHISDVRLTIALLRQTIRSHSTH